MSSVTYFQTIRSIFIYIGSPEILAYYNKKKSQEQGFSHVNIFLNHWEQRTIAGLLPEFLIGSVGYQDLYFQQALRGC